MLLLNDSCLDAESQADSVYLNTQIMLFHCALASFESDLKSAITVINVLYFHCCVARCEFIFIFHYQRPLLAF